MKNVKTWFVPSDKYRMIYLESADVADLVLNAFIKWADRRKQSDDEYVGPAVRCGRFTGTEDENGLNGSWTWRGRSYVVTNSVIVSDDP